MGFDPYDPLALARINVEVVPAGPIRGAAFEDVLTELQHCSRFVFGGTDGDNDLQAVSGDSRRLLFDFAPNRPDGSSIEAFPLEPNRAPRILLAVADGRELDTGSDDNKKESTLSFQTLQSLFDLKRLTFASTWIQILLVIHGEPFSSSREDVICASKPLRESFSRVCGLFVRQALEILDLVVNAPIRSPKLASSAWAVVDGTKTRRTTKQLDSPQTGGPSAPPSREETNSSQLLNSDQRAADGPMMSDAVSVAQGPATNSRNRGRSQIITGVFELLLGDLSSAMAQLSDGIELAQASTDYQWSMKGLEYLVICMTLLGQDKAMFTIPRVCMTSSRLSMLDIAETSKVASANATADQKRNGETSAETGLAQVLPDIVYNILTASTIEYPSGGGFPAVMRCEQNIRLTQLLVWTNGGLDVRDPAVLEALLQGPSKFPSLNLPGTDIKRRLVRFSDILVSSIAHLHQYLSTTDSISILIGLTACLSNLHLWRKQAFYLRELLGKLVQSLLEARRRGAAEIGVHPAAGLPLVEAIGSNRTSTAATNLRPFISDVLRCFGFPRTLVAHPSLMETTAPGKNGATEHKGFEGRKSGNLVLQIEVLRSCINVCDAVPDPVLSLSLITELLRTSRRRDLISADDREQLMLISVEEQTGWQDHIRRTIGASAKMGLPNLRVEYWDEFLVRRLEFMDVAGTSLLSLHSAKELSLRTGAQLEMRKDPFIFKSFRGGHAVPGTNAVAVAGEMLTFAVGLQNTLDVDVEIDEISLLTDGCGFRSVPIRALLKPFRIHEIVLSGSPNASGQLRVLGCNVRFRDCYKRDFLTYVNPIVAHETVKPGIEKQAPPVGFGKGTTSKKPQVLLITVVEPQPFVTVASSSLSQPSVMLLEGETQSFELTLKNESSTMPVDLMLFSFEDSATKQLQMALENRDLSPAEIYELSYQLKRPFVSRRRSSDEAAVVIPPLGQQVLTFDVFGKPGLFEATVQVDYAHLGKSRDEVEQGLYTRQLRYSIAVTVNGSVEIPRFNILPLGDDFLWRKNKSNIDGVAIADSESLSNAGEDSAGDQHLCLLVLDIRNVWPQPISVEIETWPNSTEGGDQLQSLAPFGQVSEHLQPGHVSRVILSRPRIFLQDPKAPVPVMDEKKQFVVSATKGSLEAEYLTRESYWYREELLKHIRGKWREPVTGKEGEIDFRKAVRLSPRMVDVLRLDEIEISFDLTPASGASSSNIVHQVSRSRFEVRTETFATLTTRIHNRSAQPLTLLLRLQPALRDQPHNVALDLTKRFAWSGVLQRVLRPPVAPGGVHKTNLGITVLAKGKYEINAIVEELRRTEHVSPAGTVGEAAVGARQIWYAREPCLIDAVPSLEET